MNNVNDYSFIYENKANQTLDNHYLKVVFNGPETNLFGVGAKGTIQQGETVYMLENYNNRGFQSST